MLITISALAKRYALSRSALLYYDRLGLLRPSGRTSAGYRQYTQEDAARLEQICMYREAGIPLRQMRDLLSESPTPYGPAARTSLMAHLSELNRRIMALRDQQTRVLQLMGSDGSGRMGRDEMVALLRGAGLDDHGLKRLHQLFERMNPGAHQAFLEGLGLEAAEVQEIRERSRTGVMDL